MRHLPRRVAILAVACAVGGCAHRPADDPADPLEPVNRVIYAFNETADRYVLRPVARGYDTVTPSFLRTGVRNFFDNLLYPTVIANDLLQLKGQLFAQDLSRFVINTTFGLVGVLDVATPTGLPKNNEDFGQTLGYWGVGEGWYLMLPLLGPSSNRDFVGRGVDAFTRPLYYVENSTTTLPLSALNAISDRADLLKADRMLEQQLDRYVFVRTIYLQHRQAKVYDGNPPAEEYGFEDEFAAEDAAAAAAAEEEGQ